MLVADYINYHIHYYCIYSENNIWSFSLFLKIFILIIFGPNCLMNWFWRVE